MTARAVVLAAAIGAATTSPAAARQVTSAALVDPDLTVGAGATLVATMGAALARAEDAVVPHRLFAERGTLRRTANVAFRLLKFSLFDAPQEQVLLVVNHELFGHGARLRERFDGPIGYRIHAPPPYGRGGASTFFVFDRAPTHYERLAVSAAGMEADAVAAALVAHRAFSERRIRARDALRYLAFELDTLSYVSSTDDDEEPGHDVADFLETYNDLAAATAAPGLTSRTLRREVLVGLANPMLVYAAYGIGRYLWNGATHVGVPALSIAGVRYLPMVRYRLAPYGTEWALVNELGGAVRPTEVELRIGRSPHATPWAIGIRQRELTRWRGWGLDASLEIWRQPGLAGATGETPMTSTRLGAQVRGRAERPLVPVWFSAHAATFIIDVGVKAAGFVPGEPLRAGLVARAGVGFPLQ
ncbi:MAG: hypothetical protein HYY76_12875 [Acidobacteria bacterium]|nr:hypothetical protein [Acidobacteriota bacterium]